MTRFTAKSSGESHAILRAVFLFAAMVNASAESAEFYSVKSPFGIYDVSSDGSVVVGDGQLWEPQNERISTFPRNFRSLAVSATGEMVVGIITNQSTGEGSPYQWTPDEGLRRIDMGLSGDVGVSDVSADGSVLLGRLANSSTNGYPRSFRWTEEHGVEMVPLLPGDVWLQFSHLSADGNVIAGGHGPLYTERVFRWTKSTGTVDLGTLDSRSDHRVYDLSHDGSVVVGAGWDEFVNEDRNTVYTRHEAFRWTEDTGMVGLGSLPDSQTNEAGLSEARVVSEDGSLVLGQIYSESDKINPDRRELFAWTQSTGMVSLTDIVETQSKVRLPANSFVSGISSDQRAIFGSSRGPNATGEFPDADRYVWAIYFDEPLSALVAATMVIGDFNRDGQLGIDDLDLLRAAIQTSSQETRFDLDASGSIDTGDLSVMVESILGTWYGDANLDGEFNSSDFTLVFLAGQYEDDVPLNSTWSTGDWNADGEFSSSDMIVAFLQGGYEQGPREQVRAVPEPTSLLLLMLGIGWLFGPLRAAKR